jgi:uncharacterized repeat protein (TIGR01451 family)
MNHRPRRGGRAALVPAAVLLVATFAALAHIAPVTDAATSHTAVNSAAIVANTPGEGLGRAETGETAAVGASAVGVATAAAVGGLLDPAVRAVLLAAPATPVAVIVHLRPQALSSSGNAALAAAAPPTGDVAALQARYAGASAGVVAYLATAQQSGQASAATALWAANALAVTADPEVVRELATRPDVRLVALDQPIVLEPWQPGAASDQPTPAGGPDAVLWNIHAVRADDVWHRLGYDGTGVTAAILDTGIDFHHPDLMTRYRGYGRDGTANLGNWWCKGPDVFCGFANSYPADGFGHGTHVAGTILAGQGVGAAPGAQWIGARVCPNETCNESWIVEALQWLLAPAGQPELRPQVVNMSFGTESESDALVLKDCIDALVAGGIVAVASAGNDPTQVTAPGNAPAAITVGAVTGQGQLWLGSGRGRSLSQEIKPEVVAPGVEITSTIPGGGWARNTGTSMATPHVAGVVALLRQARPDLSPAKIKDVLKRTATPLSAIVPDPGSGWGVVNAFAAVASVTDVGYVRGHVRRYDGQVIPWARVHLTELAGDHLATVAVNATDGSYEIAIRPGTYAVSAEAFAFEPDTRRPVEVATGAVTTVDFGLSPVAAMGQFAGWVYGSRGGSRVPLATNIQLAGVPSAFAIRSSPYTGFSAQLPPGNYEVRIPEAGYRVLTDTVQIAAGQVTTRTYDLRPAPKLLLVDGDAWLYRPAIDYFRTSLDRLGYLYDEWSVSNESAEPGAAGGPPRAADMAAYDIVIWSSSASSPGFVHAAGELGTYLAGGGRLFLSGQDALWCDAGSSGNGDSCRRHGRYPYVTDQLRVRVVRDNSGSLAVRGTADGPLAGLSFALNGPTSMDNQYAPDVLAPTDPLATSLIAVYETGEGAGVFNGWCLPQRAIAFGFGFEGIAGAGSRDAAMARVLGALWSPLPAHETKARAEPDRRVITAGATGDYTITLRSTGSDVTLVDIALADNKWDTSLWHAGFLVPLTGTLQLRPCEQTTFGVRVQAPATARRGDGDRVTVRLRIRESGAEQTLDLRTSTAAPVLVVDGDFFRNSETRYLDALQTAGIPYDLWELGLYNSAPRTPTAADLDSYPAVVWFTGYDWRPNGSLDLKSQQALAQYLTQGGRLLFVSEDYLLIRAGTPYTDSRLFHKDFLGVGEYRIDEGRAHLGTLRGGPASSLAGLEGCRMPPRTATDDLSDALVPVPGARAAVLDTLGQAVGVEYPGSPFKTMFLAFDFGLLDKTCADALMRRALDWFSPLTASQLRVVGERQTFAGGDAVKLELEIVNEGRAASKGLGLRWQLPMSTTLDSVPAGWVLEGERTLTRTGSLAVGQRLLTDVSLHLADHLPAPAFLTSSAEIVDSQGLPLRRQVSLRVNAPDLSNSRKSVPDDQRVLSVGDRTSFTIAIRNSGTRRADSVVVSDTLPVGLQLLPASIQADSGDVRVDVGTGSIVWHVAVDVGRLAALSYQAQLVSFAGGPLRNRALVSSDDGERLALTAEVFAQPRLLLPWLGKQLNQDW